MKSSQGEDSTLGTSEQGTSTLGSSTSETCALGSVLWGPVLVICTLGSVRKGPSPLFDLKF